MYLVIYQPYQVICLVKGWYTVGGVQPVTGTNCIYLVA